MTQDETLSILKTGANVFLTGEPGSGKTHTINKYIAYLRSCGIEPSITASTGIAATHIGGFTIHSWSGIGIRRTLTKYDLDQLGQKESVVRRVGKAQVLVIDEVSMLSAQTISMVDAVCREVRHRSEPFGGLQVILVGDFFQLPPISSRNTNADQTTLLETDDMGTFAYQSSVWSEFNPVICYLSEQHRQSDSSFLEFLSSIRNECTEESHKELLRTRYSKMPKDGVTQLYSHNANVDTINDIELGKLPSEPVSFEMTSRGSDKLVSSLKRGCLSPETLTLKIGARVMFTKNDNTQYKYVNGTLGTVTGFSEENDCPFVKTHDGKTILVEADEWHIEDGGRILARIIQLPLRLAWAMTVHKSQGMSLDAVHMDLSSVFEYGQGYVALSRVKTLTGLTLSGLNKRALEVHPDVLLKDSEFKNGAKQAQKTFGSLSKNELDTLHKNFVHACGGKIPKAGSEKVLEKKDVFREVSKKEGTKIDRINATLSFIDKQVSITEIAKRLDLTEDTIIKYLSELKDDKRLTTEKCRYLRKGKEKLFKEIEGAFSELGRDKLRPIFDHLEGQVPYSTIRLALLFME